MTQEGNMKNAFNSFLLPSDGLPLTRTREGRGHLLGYQSDRPRHPRLLRKKPTFIFSPEYLKPWKKMDLK